MNAAPEGRGTDTRSEASGSSPEGALEGGSYDIIAARLAEQAKALATAADSLNAARMAEFGGTELTIIGNERVRTENNCLPRDIVQVGGKLLFGYNVFLGLRSETSVSDVFSLHRFSGSADATFDLSSVPLAEGGEGFLTSPGFVAHFQELYRFYKDAKLLQLMRSETQVLAAFQIGRDIGDVRVFRWTLDARGHATYVDNRGERDYVFPPQHDFEWTLATREDQVSGPHPHVSIYDEIFVETTGGDLTIKIENNTATGEGIYAEPVDESHQTLDDAEFHYARIGSLILLKIRPYREEHSRHLVVATRSHHVVRIDAIGQACVGLPEDHGIIFPGGYYLQDGQYKVFDGDYGGFEFQRVVRAPNGEDVLYVFHHRLDGRYVLFPYNLIRREVQTPIPCSGYSLFDDGKMVVFRFTGQEPTRVHPMQIWQTPFVSAEHAAAAPVNQSLFGKLGNAELVRAVSDCLSIRRFVLEQQPSRRVYEDLIANVTRIIDAYHWLGASEVGGLKGLLENVRSTAELIVDEYEKVVAIKKRADEALAEAVKTRVALEAELRPDGWSRIDDAMSGLTRLRTERGHLITLRETRYIDVAQLQALEQRSVEHFDRLSQAAVGFLLKDDSLTPLVSELDGLLERAQKVQKTTELVPLRETLEAVGQGLTVLSEVAAALQVDDPAARTQILERISEVFAHQNRTRATLENRRRELLGAEGQAEFAAQFKLYSQSVASALGVSDTPERCDEQLSRLMVQLEELDARFSEFDAFIVELAAKREEVYEAFNQRKQQLVDERQRRVQGLWEAADRILSGVGRRAQTFKSTDELNGYFASDAMVLKLRDLAERIAALGDSVKSEEVQSRLKSARQEALRGLRDRLDLFEEGANIIKFGRHRFGVNTQPLELTILPHGDGMALSLSGTDFLEPITDPAFAETQPYWAQQLPSETESVYRAEYLAASILFDAESGRDGASIAGLHQVEREPGGLLEFVRQQAAKRYQEGYERGIHDADATLILQRLLAIHEAAGNLRFAPTPRAIACLFWAFSADGRKSTWQLRAQSLQRLRQAFGHTSDAEHLSDELGAAIAAWMESEGLDLPKSHAPTSGRYLVEELGAPFPQFITSADAKRLVDGLLLHLDRGSGARRAFEEDLRALQPDLGARFRLARAWLQAFVEDTKDVELAKLAPLVPEAAALLLTDRHIERHESHGLTATQITGLLGQHPRIVQGKLELRIDEFLERLGAFKHERLPGYLRYRQVRQELIERARRRLRVEEYKPKVLSSFVRNRLVNEVYLPLIGDNLAKQLGAAGEAKRTDLMGMLLLISPPGYGKTTLMEYVASRLGIAFVKVNGPALGHRVTSLDPAEAPNATARQEVEKINLALEMGNNAMLYLDDIQHTNPELLQKFISLCDAQRRIEGVWNGRTRTYDLRGKKFCVVMAGNPYTESGEKFQIPDMLANRADTYNLGDILAGKDDLFALSYIENAITSNAVLAPLAMREPADVHRLVRRVQGEDVPGTEFSHPYSSVELSEMAAVLTRLFAIQSVLLKVNKQYIASASTDENYRTEPKFGLQGSYRNMNKLAEKVVPAMNEAELERLVDDHYVSESQTLTTGAEHNLLKLAELRGSMTAEQRQRWEQIKKDFQRVKLMGGTDDDPVARVTGQLSGMTDRLDGRLEKIGQSMGATQQLVVQIANLERAFREVSKREATGTNGQQDRDALLVKYLQHVEEALHALASPKLEVRVHNAPPPGVEEALAQQIAIVERTLVPLVRIATQHLDDPMGLSTQVEELLTKVKAIDERLREGRTGVYGR